MGALVARDPFDEIEDERIVFGKHCGLASGRDGTR